MHSMVRSSLGSAPLRCCSTAALRISITWQAVLSRFFAVMSMMRLSAAAFAAAEEEIQTSQDAGADANTLVDGDSVGNKSADVLRFVGGFGQGTSQQIGRLHDMLARSLQLQTCGFLPLLYGSKDVGGVQNAVHGCSSSSSLS